MPLQYQGVIAEHTAVRTAAGLFDVSHLGKLIVKGAGAEAALDRLLPGKVAALGQFRAGYNLVLNEKGGIVDDVFVYRHPEMFIVIPNASNSDEVKGIFEERFGGDVTVEEGRERWAIIAFSGPKARDSLKEIAPEAATLKLHSFAETRVAGMEVLAARTGYTGEYTCEILCSWEDAPRIWDTLTQAGAEAGVVPAGLGSRDTLRLEMGYPLHGLDISPDTDPIEAGLGWVIQWDKQFDAKQALEELRDSGTRRLVGLEMQGRDIPRAHYEVQSEGRKVGEVTSGNFSPVLRKGIAMAYVESGLAEPGTMLAIDVRGRQAPAEVTNTPFIRK